MPGRCVLPPPGRLAAAAIACLLAAACGSPATRAPSPAAEKARAHNQAGTRALSDGNLPAALAQYRESLAGAESIEDFELAAANLLNIAFVHQQLGQWREAHTASDRIIAAPQRYGKAATAGAAARKAFIHLDEGDADAALRWSDAAERDCPAPCAPLAAIENLRAHVALGRSQADAALRHASRAAGLAPAPGAEHANAQRLLGRAQTASGRFAEAAQSLAAALALDRQLGLSGRIALDLLYAGDNEAKRNDTARAREFYQRAAAVFAASSDAQGAQTAGSRLEALPR